MPHHMCISGQFSQRPTYTLRANSHTYKQFVYQVCELALGVWNGLRY